MGPARLAGVDLGDAVEITRRKLAHLPPGVLELQRGDLVTARLGEFDLAYCIGVLHHIQDPRSGFEALLRHTRPGACFHGWVYAREGNGFVVRVLDRVRRLGARLPWWVTRWVTGLGFGLLAFAWAKGLRLLPARLAERLPAGPYALSLADRDFAFFHFLATDFLVARHTTYFDRATIAGWLEHPDVDPASVYLIHRNGNSWKFGGRRRAGRVLTS